MTTHERLTVFGGFSLVVVLFVVVLTMPSSLPIIHALTVALLTLSAGLYIFYILPNWQRIVRMRIETRKLQQQHAALAATLAQRGRN